jgi:uncharacterized protein with HEPN domain
MKKKSYIVFVEDILSSMEKIERYISNSDYETFKENEMIVDAIIRNLEIIGEASKNIPDDIRKRYSDIPWKRMVGLRNIAIHEYSKIDLKMIWKIIKKNLPETKQEILKILDTMKETM